jgi:hypothetical protein
VSLHRAQLEHRVSAEPAPSAELSSNTALGGNHLRRANEPTEALGWRDEQPDLFP